MRDLITMTLLGTGATAFMDLWGLVRRPLLGLPAPDYALLGRWVAHMPRGRFWHASIASAQAVPGERLLGWAAHYVTGIVFAACLVSYAGRDWLQLPTLGVALGAGIVSVAAPFLVMQPAMGAGWAASRTAAPARARLQSLVTHAAFGFGLYLTALVLRHLSL